MREVAISLGLFLGFIVSGRVSCIVNVSPSGWLSETFRLITIFTKNENDDFLD